MPVLRARLRAARRLWRIGALIECAVWSIVAALALLCLQAAPALLHLGASTWLAPVSGSAAAIEPALAVFAVAFAVGSLLLCLRTPALDSFARIADHKLALREQLSTALEVDKRMPSDAPFDPIRSVLLAHVERHALNVDPRAIVRLGVPRAIWLLPALGLVATLLHLAPVDALASRHPVVDSRENNALSKDAAEKAIANLRRVADLLNQDADQHGDPYLRTIARALEHLEIEVEHASLDRHELANALDRLLAHSRQAYAQNAKGDRGDAAPKAVDLLAAAHDDIAGVNPDRPPAPRRPDHADPAAAAAAERATASATQPTSSASRPQRQARSDATIAPPSSNRAPDQANAQKDRDEYGDVEIDPRTQMERAFAEQQRRMRAAVQAVGASADAGAGEGDRAGNGTRPLANDVATRTDLAPSADMLLPDQPGNDGRRIRIELTPQTTLSNVSPPAAVGDRHWRQIGEHPVARSVFDAGDRKVVGRYFMPPQESNGR